MTSVTLHQREPRCLRWRKQFPFLGARGYPVHMAPDAQTFPDALSAMELFHGLPASALETVAVAARVRRLPKDMRIFNQGDPDARAHAVIEGVVRIVQSGSDGAQAILRLVGPGEIFGTVALFADGCYPADAVTVSETLEISWSKSELLDLMARYPLVAINVIRIVGKRLQDVQERVRELATLNAERRVAHAVLRLARQAGHGATDGTAIDFPLRRKDVADIAGTTLHTASRILTAWEKAGLLVTRRQHLTIRQPAQLLRIAEDGADQGGRSR
ncbi:MAG: Crp/Fnr family transcriptional regulator [Caulobacteraceae bacterium]